MIDKKTIDSELQALNDVKKSYPFEKNLAVYSLGEEMFALLAENATPLQLSLRCDSQLATLLREKYETVLSGRRLDKRHWNTLILSGQLPLDEVKSLIRHAYEQANELQGK